MAYTLPESTFVGIDRAEIPVSNGNAEIAELGLRNVALNRIARRGTRAGGGRSVGDPSGQ